MLTQPSPSSSPLHIIILAAGKGKRMRSATPKVLQKIGGLPLLAHVIAAANSLRPTAIHVVYGEAGHEVRAEIERCCTPLFCTVHKADAPHSHHASNASQHHAIGAALGANNSNILNWIEQREQLGTGHAVQQVLPHIPLSAGDTSNLASNLDKDAQVIILYGDVPLIQPRTLRALLTKVQERINEQHKHAKHVNNSSNTITLLTANLSDPTGYGRIVRINNATNTSNTANNFSQSNQQIISIVEEKDASVEQRNITEINTGIICTTAALLHRYLPSLQPHNQQGEYYLTDIVALALADGCTIDNTCASDAVEVAGVNNKLQLATLERCYQHRTAKHLMLQGVTIIDPQRLDVRAEVCVNTLDRDSNGAEIKTDGTALKCATDVTLDVNVILEGKIEIGAHSTIGANCYVKDSVIGSNVTIKANSFIEGAVIDDNCVIGPFARVRPHSHIAHGAHVGNFVEVKNTALGIGSKANHLSYLGDAMIGANVNIGAGTITCNYDGANKYQTIIEDGAFIGSNSQLVAPVTIGKNATIGSGSTITCNAPADKLTIARAHQVTVEGWQRPVKKK